MQRNGLDDLREARRRLALDQVEFAYRRRLLEQSRDSQRTAWADLGEIRELLAVAAERQVPA